ncbi:hypothetical protein GYMLUDRAFT_250365 [Collybiopsis luxurians FD-317 M1]|uniref:Uncharacterized protein n=1 Tax=Collybiopsis luxurians FD-317 M1 TaxID=944289 RepID=A0A0D0AT16_9AGAR|nr:hypothetical protein GYMLUDRAFT_250365 [Collybiopsis luxurians FD-317 M1]
MLKMQQRRFLDIEAGEANDDEEEYQSDNSNLLDGETRTPTSSNSTLPLQLSTAPVRRSSPSVFCNIYHRYRAESPSPLPTPQHSASFEIHPSISSRSPSPNLPPINEVAWNTLVMSIRLPSAQEPSSRLSSPDLPSINEVSQSTVATVIPSSSSAEWNFTGTSSTVALSQSQAHQFCAAFDSAQDSESLIELDERLAALYKDLHDQLDIHNDQQFLPNYPIFHVEKLLLFNVTDRLSDDTESNQDLDLLGSTDGLDDNSELDEDIHSLEDSEEVDEKKFYMPVDRQTIVDVYPSQVLGFIYLQAPNMNPSNELLATHLRLVPAFKYRNCPQFTSSQGNAVEGRCVTIWDRHHLELPIHH